ncbi:MAG: hypothetical protein MJZ11_04040 [Lachnospiraceae bacterium]|nr:hypothetical protein [Lachnospiraceae bacterium]
MEDNKYFQKALGDFTYDVACGAAIRHLHDIGFTPEEIEKRLDYPVSLTKINNTIKKYEEKKLQDEKLGGKTRIVQEMNEYGKISFRRIKEDNSK